ncbi:uncharacterized protein PV06_10298 [Exophiala oligosperma]|uniref:DH domain-containing protein n=1 Tax=Exophiala oligosperma TaxID=215243 RepID=A0A0D2D2W3_9EURO|nr:uncharacterized protein PV06_10298 [Exophiala oligosperma]KIW37658.1 hypothetical protein PV06_10298 [Exophiala oligosperma]
MLASPPAMNGDHGPMLDRNNIINVRDGESLYQICIKLRRRLSGVPGFRPYLEEMEEREAEGSDPVSSLWQCFRSGLPLLTIYNASNPEEGDLRVDTKRPERVGKEAAFLFIKACMQQMEIPAADTFTVTDLYSDNTTGFVKVTKLINRVLDILKLSGKLHPSTDSEGSRDGADSALNVADQAPKTLTRRQHILKELVETERQYVHHLQNLQTLKKEMEEVGALTGDAIHNIFLNLNNLLDFAQRFLIRIEQQNETPEEQQNWGRLFVHYKDPFRQYEPFIANQRRCETTCQQEWDRMVERAKSPLAQQMLANPTILNGFLLKPFQRLTKYPLLLKDLQNQTSDNLLKSDISDAIAIIQDVLMQADASIDKETRDDALQDLTERVDDWKQMNIASFGELLLLGTFNVTKESAIRSDEKEYHIYLFSRILIMCKDVNANKPKNRLANNKPSLSRNGKPKMNLKGRIYFTNVISVTSHTSPGSYSLQITWKTEANSPDIFNIKYKNDETLQKWHTMIETQRSSCMLESRTTGTTSDTQLLSLQGMNMENPYIGKDDDDDDYSRISGTTYGGTDATGYSEFNMSRNASSTSLRSRSATGGSGGSNPHLSAGRMRVPTSELGGLSLNTRGLPIQSPQDSYGSSYFSPIERDSTPQSTISARSSSQSAFSGYHRGATPVSGGGQRPEESYRNTAPAMARNPNGQPSGNPYLVNGRRGPPPGPGQPRMRSASSPDVHPLVQQSRKYVSGEHAPSVPPIPAHVAKQMAPPARSQNNSPNNGPPSRQGTPQQYGLPQAPRPGMPNSNYTYDNSYGNDPRRPGHAPSLSQSQTFSPPVSSPSSDGDGYIPSQLKAKVCFDENYVSMIIATNIQFRSLADRIDAKLARFTNHSIASGSVRLHYRDEDDDLILIDSDEAVHEALLDWRETHASNAANPQNAELLLYAHAVNRDGVAG